MSASIQIKKLQEHTENVQQKLHEKKTTYLTLLNEVTTELMTQLILKAFYPSQFQKIVSIHATISL